MILLVLYFFTNLCFFIILVLTHKNYYDNIQHVLASYRLVQHMREWLSGGAPPCQGGGRGFDSRLALPMLSIRLA